MNTLKRCPKCTVERLVTEFRPHKGKKDGLQSVCKVCDKEYQKDWYQKNKSLHCERSSLNRKNQRDNAREFIINYLKTHHCVECGESNMLTLEFHHICCKKHNISYMVRVGSSLKSIKNEIQKCEVLCSNCHKKKTAQEFNWYKMTGIVREAGSSAKALE